MRDREVYLRGGWFIAIRLFLFLNLDGEEWRFSVGRPYRCPPGEAQRNRTDFRADCIVLCFRGRVSSVTTTRANIGRSNR